MDSQYLRSVEQLDLNADNIKATFKDAEPYQGDLQGLKEHVKAHKAHFKDVQVDGAKAGAFLSFIPSTRRERDWLAGKTGVVISKGAVFTFGTRHSATLAWKELKELGINTKPSSWPIAIIQQQK